MTFYILASVRQAPPTTQAPVWDSRSLWLESWDGSVILPIPLDSQVHEIIGRRGLLGLGVAPTDLVTAGTPGVAGSRVVDVVQPARPVALPLAILADTQTDLWATVQKLRDVTDPTRAMTPDGNFRLVCASSSGTRQLNLAYQSGLEGEDLEYEGVDQGVLSALAVLPYAQDRTDQERTFKLAIDTSPFLSSPGSGYLWGTRKIVSGTIAGSDTPFEMFSAVPVYPVIEITGPADSVLITAPNGLLIDVPAGVPSEQTLRIVTDPRAPSVRLNGALAAGMLARGSRRAAFPLGVTPVSVNATGTTTATRLRISWRGLHRSLW